MPVLDLPRPLVCGRMAKMSTECVPGISAFRESRLFTVTRENSASDITIQFLNHNHNANSTAARHCRAYHRRSRPATLHTLCCRVSCRPKYRMVWGETQSIHRLVD